MADVEEPAPSAPPTAPQAETQKPKGTRQAKASAAKPKIPLHQLYALPAPIRTFPLPSFYPNNPLSLFHVLWAWANQVLFPPPAEPSVVHQGQWSPETRSVHVRDPTFIRALWEQGFFGKGSYSRSEPNWLKRELSRQGQGEKKVAELVTAKRREERKMMKWDRARKEQEAILKTRLAEAFVAPVGPKELLALPNSPQDLLRLSSLTELPNGHATAQPPVTPQNPSPPSLSEPETVPVTPKRRKSVRFSPTVESATYDLSDPPSPHLGSLLNGRAANGSPPIAAAPLPEPVQTRPSEKPDAPCATESTEKKEVADKEHLQLSPEEAFYLVFALGALSVVDPSTGKPMTCRELFSKLRQLSLPRGSTGMRPDDPFLVQYAVYHHFRSLGWVPRSGIKFGVDWLLYIGGPVFSHAEFAVIVLPAYTDPYWKTHEHAPLERSWHWLHSVNRVQSHALKTMVIVYVDIPPPTEDQDPSALLQRYKVREFFMKRWLSNRSR
ncbi:hypothetical protein F5Y17DRAFT_466901 [Xylariaceae sp. FL0594]|nr:hypothetical protein F5Y17DRAFT_466901 [Xylariaceae sp. FL0594]